MRNPANFSYPTRVRTSISAVPNGNPVQDRVPAQAIEECLHVIPTGAAVAEISDAVEVCDGGAVAELSDIAEVSDSSRT